MVVSMLEAISSMLEQGDGTETQAYMVKAACAKTMLDKVIEGMRSSAIVTSAVNVEQASRPQKTKPEKDEIQVVVEHGKITNVLHAKEDTQLELDGKVYPWQECIGKSFSTGRVI